MARISLRGLLKRYGSVAAVDDLSLEIADGEFVTMLGPSGCGKTTTLRMLAGFVRPDGGEISVDGRVISTSRQTVPPERRAMGMVFQSYALWPHMTVFDNVAFGLAVRGVSSKSQRERVEKVLEQVGLAAMGPRLPGQLSGGQQQRVALARALVVEPSILLLDEPLSNLDAKLRERMRGELKDLQRRTKITFIYVTHDQTEALALSDRVAVLHAGRLQQYAPPRDVYERPSNSLVADFMGQVTLWPGLVSGQPSASGRVTVMTDKNLAIVAETEQILQSGQKVTVAIRPESVALWHGCPGDQVNVFPVQIAEVTFLGNLVQLGLECGGQSLRAQLPPGGDWEVGATAYASVEPYRVVVLI